ncbi:hypothetical protein CDL15_Pgr014650 [Punica granatum]|nr:hypothetical protein CDL15_Pgr014650 [Punica granatum]
MGVISKDEKEGPDRSKKSSLRHKRIERDRRVIQGSGSYVNGVLDENWSSDSSWADSTNEDYIVFHIRKDGAIDVVKEGKQESSNPLHQAGEYSSSVDGKLDLASKIAESTQQRNVGPRSSEDGIAAANTDFIVSQNKDHQIKLDEEKDGDRGRQSNRSDGSFSFPV